jgi:hypothetical protein
MSLDDIHEHRLALTQAIAPAGEKEYAAADHFVAFLTRQQKRQQDCIRLLARQWHEGNGKSDAFRFRFDLPPRMNFDGDHRPTVIISVLMVEHCAFRSIRHRIASIFTATVVERKA